MENWMTLVLGILLNFSLAFNVHAQDKRFFDIIVKGDTVGDLVANRSYSGENMIIEITTNMKVRLIQRVDFAYYLVAEYDKAGLIRSEMTVKLQGREHNNIRVEKVADETYVVREDGKSRQMHQLISFSSARLFFEEPTRVQETFTESEGYSKQIIKDGEHRYLVKGSKSKPNVYQYDKDGVLLEIKSSHAMIPDFRTVRRKQ
ncbi:DUF6134 family protein [Persicobacter diffluens]|uniref:Uncharacterized protein n=1 Tax=Persicobacter diffluens TaxID=981 RepID=A0AAN4VZ26_9BACT|nr:hypothetical protein PEDI_32430 [Persicobacter diffluens]